MILSLILGLIILVISLIFNNLPNFSKYSKTLRIAAIGVILVGIFLSSFRQINAGFVGVKSLFGSIQSTPLQSGLHIVNPLLDVTQIDVRTQNYTMSGVHNEGEVQGDDAIRVLTADGLEVTIDLTVLFKVVASETPNLLKVIGGDFKDKIVRPICRTKIRDNAVYYEAIALYSTRRDEFQTRIYNSIESDFKKRGLILEQLLIRNISLPAAVRKSIEEKISAEQDAQKMQFVLQKEKQEAERKRVEAQGIADYQRIINTGLTDQQLQYEAIKAQLEIAKSPNAKVIIMGKGNSPIILDGK
ncbi:MAG: prohibitin family protein [Bacteroidia bacterium]|nr:prohibitin family protein [Bacteroidia bacterium]